MSGVRPESERVSGVRHRRARRTNARDYAAKAFCIRSIASTRRWDSEAMPAGAAEDLLDGIGDDVSSMTRP